MRKIIKDIITVMTLEWRKLVLNVLAITVILAGSAIYSVYYPYPYKNDIVRNMPIAFVDNDKSMLSDKIYTMLSSTESITPIKYNSMEEAKIALYNRDIHGIINIPYEFNKDVLKGISPTVTLFGDGSYFIIYSTAFSNITRVVMTTVAGVKIKKMNMQGISTRDAINLQSAANVVPRPLFSPNAGYVGYVAPAIYSIIVQQIMLLVILLVQAGGYESGHNYPRGVSTLSVLLGKLFAYIPIFVTIYSYFFTVGPMLFGFNTRNNIYELFMYSFPFGLAVTLFGISLSYFAREKEGVFLVLLMTSIPFVMLSGFLWPDWMMPKIIKVISYLIPSTSGVTGFLFIRQMGADISDIFMKYINLWLLILLYGVTAYLAVKWQLRQKNAYINESYYINSSKTKHKNTKNKINSKNVSVDELINNSDETIRNLILKERSKNLDNKE